MSKSVWAHGVLFLESENSNAMCMKLLGKVSKKWCTNEILTNISYKSGTRFEAAMSIYLTIYRAHLVYCVTRAPTGHLVDEYLFEILSETANKTKTEW